MKSLTLRCIHYLSCEEPTKNLLRLKISSVSKYFDENACQIELALLFLFSSDSMVLPLSAN